MIINKNKRFYIYLFCIFTLFISYLLGENSSGGSEIDNIITLQFVENFKYGFSYGLNYFISTQQIHSPIFYFLKAKFLLISNEEIFSLTYLLLSSIIPLFFYKTLKKKFTNSENKNILFAISLLIFLSPYFRSSAVWATSDNLALLFVTISLYFFISSFSKLKKKSYYYFISILFLIIASYIRQNYSLLFIFYIIKSFEILERKTIIYIILISFLLSFPALLYVKKIYESGYNLSTLEPDYLNNSIIYLSIISFYLLPFFWSEKNKNKYKNLILNRKKILLFFSLIVILIFFYSDIERSDLGGGVILKLSKIIEFNFLFLIFAILGILLINYYYENLSGLLTIILLFLSYPISILYQKYFDPIFILFFLILSGSKILQDNLEKNQFNIKVLYFYFGAFLFAANYYYLNN